MTSNLINIINFILSEQTNRSGISISKLTKIIYLIDWRSSITIGRQITDLQWHANIHGPYTKTILEESQKEKNIIITTTINELGNKKTFLTLEHSRKPELNRDIIDTINFVLDATKNKINRDLEKLVDSTYPIVSSEKYSELDLTQKAMEYKNYLVSTQKYRSNLNKPEDK